MVKTQIYKLYNVTVGCVTTICIHTVRFIIIIISLLYNKRQHRPEVVIIVYNVHVVRAISIARHGGGNSQGAIRKPCCYWCRQLTNR